MIAHRKEKTEKRRTVLLDRWFPLSQLEETAVIGSFSITTPTTRYMLAKDAFDYGAGFCSPADIARDYLSTKFGKMRRRITTNQYRNFMDFHRSAPIYCRPQLIPEASYVDIQGAYWAILQAVGWDVDYLPQRFIRVRSDVRDFPFPDMKMARNCLVSVGVDPVTNLKIWNDGQLSMRKTGNMFVNKSLWSIVMDTLNAIAYEAVMLGANYVFTDGYIIESSKEQELIRMIASWGLPARVKHRGFTYVLAPAAYAIGSYQSKPYKRAKRPRSFAKITQYVEPSWLKARLERFSSNT